MHFMIQRTVTALSRSVSEISGVNTNEVCQIQGIHIEKYSYFTVVHYSYNFMIFISK
jgi:hypothetical protein